MSTVAQITERVEPRRSWLFAGLLLAGLVAALYVPVIQQMVLQWWQDPNYGHGILVPFFAGYVVWRQRRDLQCIELAPSNFGLLVMLAAVTMLIVGSLGAELFVSRFSLLVLLTGMVLFLAGWKMLRALAFPLGYLVLMIPLPVIIYNQVTFPLQFLASKLAANSLQILGVPVLREGNVLLLPNYALEVVDACSGIRSLMSLIALAVAYGYLVERRTWIRITLAALMLPIAVASNAARVVGTGLLTYFFGPQSAEGFFHLFSGWLIFVAAVMLMLLAHWVLRRMSNFRRNENA